MPSHWGAKGLSPASPQGTWGPKGLSQNTGVRVYFCQNTRGTGNDSGFTPGMSGMLCILTSCLVSHTHRTRKENENTPWVLLFMLRSFLSEPLFLLQLYWGLVFTSLCSAVLLVRLNNMWRAWQCACMYGYSCMFLRCLKHCSHFVLVRTKRWSKFEVWRLTFVGLVYTWNSEFQRSILYHVRCVTLCVFNRIRFLNIY